MNITILLGGLTETPKLIQTPAGKNYTYFSLAVNRKYGDKELTDYINCVAWDKTAENISKYCIKGSRLLIEGRLQTRTYQTQDGTKKSATEVVVKTATFISKPKTDAVVFPSGAQPTNQFVSSSQNQKPIENVAIDDLLKESDYPFD